jgi:hypothetical protein
MSDRIITESELLAQGTPPEIIRQLLPDAHTSLSREPCWLLEFVEDRLLLLPDGRKCE